MKGDPHPERISTSYVERQNLTMRMEMRRFTRVTNGFSRKVENLSHAVSLHFMHYNFARPHRSLKDKYPRTPAMAAGLPITAGLWKRSRRCWTELQCASQLAVGFLYGCLADAHCVDLDDLGCFQP